MIRARSPLRETFGEAREAAPLSEKEDLFLSDYLQPFVKRHRRSREAGGRSETFGLAKRARESPKVSLRPLCPLLAPGVREKRLTKDFASRSASALASPFVMRERAGRTQEERGKQIIEGEARPPVSQRGQSGRHF